MGNERLIIKKSGLGKPPKLRFKPGNFISIGDEILEVMYVYRLISNPKEWMYSLQYRDSVKEFVPDDTAGRMLYYRGVGNNIPRIVYDYFANETNAHMYFAEIPLWTDSLTASNAYLMKNKAKLLSTGFIRD